jgi:hypothetical protein
VYWDGGDLFEEYQALRSASPSERGRALPHLLVRVFEWAGFQAKEHARAAMPRDTDLFLTYDDDYLLEAKWTSRRVDIDAVDELRCRLARTAGHVTGLFVSVAGFSAGAIRAVEADRSRLILLLDGEDLEALLAGRVSPATLLRIRKRALVRDAVALVGRRPATGTEPPADATALRRGDAILIDPHGMELPWVVSEGPSGHEVYVESIPDVDWTAAQGRGVGLDASLPVATVSDLVRALVMLERAGWISGAGRFAIHQPDLAWHGVGAFGFVNALQRQAERHRLRRRWHNEEYAVYFDHCPNGSGLYTLTSRVWTHRGRLVDTVLSVQLPGVPVDATRIRLLLESLGLDELGDFWPLEGHARARSWQLNEGDAPLHVAAWLRDVTDEEWVRGIVTDNPLFRDAPVAGKTPAVPAILQRSDRLVCSLRSWHRATDAVGPYSVIRIEQAWTGTAQVISIGADWAAPESEPPAATVPPPPDLSKDGRRPGSCTTW